MLRSLSDTAPIFAHEVGGESTRLDTPSSRWFWLFYSALDRRGNAALFIRARNRLEQEGLFDPKTLCDLAEREGEPSARRRIASLLQEAEVPLVVDLHFGRESLAQSVIDAAKFVVSNGGFESILETWRQDCSASGEDIGRHAVRAVQKAIYGMGPRSSAQFVRGMGLKGPWRLDLRDQSFLENTKYHGLFAGRARLSIAVEDYPKEGADFADLHLDGDKGGTEPRSLVTSESDTATRSLSAVYVRSRDTALTFVEKGWLKSVRIARRRTGVLAYGS